MNRIAASILILALLGVALVAQDTFTKEHLERALALHRRHVVLDTHSDTTPKFERPTWDFSARHDDGHMDMPRMRDAGFNAQFWSIYMGRTPGEGKAIKKALERIDSVYEQVRKFPEHLEMACTADDVRRISKAGRIACLMGIEGGHIIEDSIPALRMMFRLGCRYMTLTHSFNTAWADAAGVDESAKAEHGGLTPFGEEIVREMNRLGMMVDISHVSDATFRHVMKITKAPVIASHSSSRKIYEHRRNLSDDMLRALAKNRGVLMVNFYNGFIDSEYAAREKQWRIDHKTQIDAIKKKYKAGYWGKLDEYAKQHPIPKTPLVVLARHIEHAAEIMGWDHVGIGADWDGVPALPVDMDHCGDLPKLTALLLARGAKEEDLAKYLGANLLRVMDEVESRAGDS